MAAMSEEWRDIPGFAPYQASNLGRIRRSPDAPKRKGGFPGRVLRIAPSPRGYVIVALYVNGRRVGILGHRLVALAFLGPRPPGLVINHIDGCKFNNALSNLEYVTPQENSLHALRTGLMKPIPVRRGRDNSTPRKLTPEKVVDIRRRLADGESRRSIAAHYGVDKRLVQHIDQGKVWAWV